MDNQSFFDKPFNSIFILIIFLFITSFGILQPKDKCGEIATVNEPSRYYMVDGYDTKSKEIKEDFICIDIGYGKGYWGCYDENGKKIARFTGERSMRKMYDGKHNSK